jgi:hypothetical protein
MAALTEGTQVAPPIVCWVVVEMRGREHHPRRALLREVDDLWLRDGTVLVIPPER